MQLALISKGPFVLDPSLTVHSDISPNLNPSLLPAPPSPTFSRWPSHVMRWGAQISTNALQLGPTSFVSVTNDQIIVRMYCVHTILYRVHTHFLVVEWRTPEVKAPVTSRTSQPLPPARPPPGPLSHRPHNKMQPTCLARLSGMSRPSLPRLANNNPNISDNGYRLLDFTNYVGLEPPKPIDRTAH